MAENQRFGKVYLGHGWTASSAGRRRGQANIGVSYAVTYLFGFTLVVFFVSVIAPKMLGVDLVEAAESFEKELGDVGEDLASAQEETLRQVLGRVFEITRKRADAMTVAALEKQYDGDVTVQQISRKQRNLAVSSDVALAIGDRVALLVPLVTSMYYARYVLKMNPVVICGALAGLLTCTAGLNAVVAEAKSQTPVLGYTVPYAIANVVLTLLGPVIVLTTG